MRIMIDPHMDSCHVWFSDGNLETLKGYTKQICARIARFVMNEYVKSTGEQVLEQVCEVYIDDFGVGRAYRLQLEDMGVKVSSITRIPRIFNY